MIKVSTLLLGSILAMCSGGAGSSEFPDTLGSVPEIDAELPTAAAQYEAKYTDGSRKLVWLGPTKDGWSIERHPISGVPVARFFVAGALVKPNLGNFCNFSYLRFTQEAFPDGSYGPTKLDARPGAGGGGRVGCDFADAANFGMRRSGDVMTPVGGAAAAAPEAATPEAAPVEAAPEAAPAG